MSSSQNDKRQKVTISFSRQTLQKARVLAAERQISISGLITEQIETLVGGAEAYERAKRQALSLLKQRFHMGGIITVGRDELHER